LILLVVNETSEVTSMARKLAKNELVAFVARQRIDKLEADRHSITKNTIIPIVLRKGNG
jgi:uncharacterized protein (UPF0335 family)